MTSPTWRALGQVVSVYVAVGGAAVTAQDTQPGRATFAEMIAFARLASVPCQRLAPDADSFHALLAAGASAMPAKWSRRVFSFRFYEGKISVPVTLISCTFRKSYPDVMAPRLSRINLQRGLLLPRFRRVSRPSLEFGSDPSNPRELGWCRPRKHPCRDPGLRPSCLSPTPQLKRE
jgi:hypothetical protein